MRSLWKGPYINKNLYNDIIQDKNLIEIMDRSSTIIPSMIHKEFKIYDGLKFRLLKIESNMVGFKLGEFIFTKKKCIYRNKKNRKK